jgi:hypothetical protein
MKYYDKPIKTNVNIQPELEGLVQWYTQQVRYTLVYITIQQNVTRLPIHENLKKAYLALKRRVHRRR